MDLWTLTDLCTPWCIYTAVTLRVAEHIAHGEAGIDALAAACEADPDSLSRVLRHLAGRGFFEEPEAGTFALNDAARELMTESARVGFDLTGIGGRMAGAWSTLPEAVRTGRPAYRQVFGRPFWEDLDANPGVAASFDALMGTAGHGIPDPNVLLDSSDWPSIATVVDIGGGTGALLTEILRAHPHVQGTLVDLPGTVERARAKFAGAGAADRVTIAGQSFFDPLPAGADIYLLKNVLGDWPDREATALLARCAEAARPHGRIVILGGVTPEERAGPELLMLVLVGGKGRTLEELRALARAAGLTITRSGHGPSGRFVVECRCSELAPPPQ